MKLVLKFYSHRVFKINKSKCTYRIIGTALVLRSVKYRIGLNRTGLNRIVQFLYIFGFFVRL